ncbi:WD40 repeat domain-containing protein [Streptomyces luteogriseus]|uniref:WD40 repeat domain-containing protein n=1 Tax=Streptomyces luteogriseus TaxID=68233 RepID=UPI0037B463CF
MDIAPLLVAMPPLKEREEIRRGLLSPGQPVFAYVRERVAAEDVATLRVLRDEDRPLHRLLTPRAAAASSVRSLVGHPPYLKEEPAAAQSLRAAAAMGLALVGDAGQCAGELASGLLWLRRNHAHPGYEHIAALDLAAATEAGHATRLRRLTDAVPEADRDLALPALTWLLALDGALPTARTVATATVLFDDGRGGVRGTLTAAVLPEGPPALLPDPRIMSGFRGDEGFRQSLRDAWDGAGHGVRSTVLWSLTDAEGVVGMVEDTSLGCAFAVLLGEVARAGRRLRPPALRKVNPRTALVGALDPARPGTLASVGGYEAKLKAAGEGTNVVVPAADRADAGRALPGGTAGGLLYAETVREAARGARMWDLPVVKRWSVTVVAVLIVLLVISVSVIRAVSESGEAEARKALAADLAAEAMLQRGTDPRLAGLLGLAAYTIEPDTPRAVQAMRDVLEANSGVRMSWRASPAAVNGIAVDDKRGRVHTSGDDPYVKTWDLLTGKELGRAEGAVTDLVFDEGSGLLAGRDGKAVSVYSVLEPAPRLMGRLGTPSCGGKGTRPVATAFANSGVRLVEVRDDGVVAQYDTTTLEEVSCRRTGDQEVDGRTVPMEPGSVLDATVAPGTKQAGNGELPEEERALLLVESDDVLAVGLDSHKVTTEIRRDDIQGEAFQIAANDADVLLASAQGVQAWDRRHRRQLAFPVGGLAYPPRALAERSGSVVIAGDNGTALVPVGTGDQAIASRDLEEPRGGPAVTAAVGELFTVVAAGRGGRVNVLDRRPGPLSLSPAVQSNVANFGPEGHMVMTEVVVAGSDGVYTIDPDTVPEIALNPAEQSYRPLAQYSFQSFDIRDAAARGKLVVAVGTYEGRSVLGVWSKGKDVPRTLRVPALDRAAGSTEQALTDVAFVPGKDLLVARHADGPLAIWSTRTWKLVNTVQVGQGSGLAVHGRHALALEGEARGGPRLVLVDLTTGTTHAAAAPGAERIAWSHDGSRIAVLGGDGTVRYRNAGLKETGEPLVLPGTTERPTALALAPDGRHVAVAAGDEVLVYDTATGLQALPTLHSSRGQRITRLAWSPDGHFLAGVTSPVDSGEAPGPVSLWRVDGIDWRNQVCRWTGGAGLSTKEWRTHIGERHAYTDLCAETK